MWRLLVALRVVAAAPAPRFAVCFAGQLRTGSLEAIQENLYRNLVEPLAADLFFYVAATHEVSHAAGPGGCLPTTKDTCVVADGSKPSRSRNTAVRRGRYGSLRAPNAAEELEFLRTEGPLAASIVAFEVLEDDEAVARATALHASRGRLHQKTLRARCALCLHAIAERERAVGAPYDYVVRARPDYVFTCLLPSAASGYYATRGAEVARAGGNATLWATTHRDYWELMTRDAAEIALGGLWRDAGETLAQCHPRPEEPWAPGASVKSRVESCLYMALCSRGAIVTGTETFYDTSREAKAAKRERRLQTEAAERGDANASFPPPPSPGVIIRPCCDSAATNDRLLAPPPRAVCTMATPQTLAEWALNAYRENDEKWFPAREQILDRSRAVCASRTPYTHRAAETGAGAPPTTCGGPISRKLVG